MTFLWAPFLALLLLVPLLLALYVWQQRRGKPVGGRFSSLSLIRAAAPGSNRIRRHLPFALFLVAIGALAIAVARPSAIVDVPSGQRTIIFTLDVSGSMCSTDIVPNRLIAAENAAAQFVQKDGGASQIGIVAFSTFGEIIQSPTNSEDDLLDALNSLTVGRRTAIGSGLLSSIDAIADVDPSVQHAVTDTSGGTEPAPVPKGDYAPAIIVLLTDGESNTGPDPLDAAQEAVDRGIRVYTIGYGTANGGAIDCGSQFIGREPGAFGGGGFGGGTQQQQPGVSKRGIDETVLMQIADMTGGKYYSAESADELNAVFASLPADTIVKHEVVELSAMFVGIGVAFAALGLLLARLWRPLP